MIYHGSEKIINIPEKRKGKLYNDYGQGFYLTDDFDMAGEWACKNMKNGFINCYNINDKNLSKLDLLDKKYNILHWLTILLQNRRFDISTDIAARAKNFLDKNFKINLEKYDIIKGYRADDSYFSFANDFINNIITYGKLKKAFALGELGKQIFIRTDKAFKELKFEAAHPVEYYIYYPKFKFRDEYARKEYHKIKDNISKKEDFYIADILKGAINYESLS